MSAPTPIGLTFPEEVLEQIAQRVAEILAERTSTATAIGIQRWFTIDEAAEYARCSRQRIYNLRSSGRLSRHGDGGRALVDRQELEALIQGGGMR